MFAYLKNLGACWANWCEGAILNFAKLQNAKLQTPGFLLTHHKKMENAGF